MILDYSYNYAINMYQHVATIEMYVKNTKQ